MALTTSTPNPLGFPAPTFALPDSFGVTWSLEDFAESQGLIVAFICNHCPFVQLIAPDMSLFADECRERGVGFVAINANDISRYPDDSPENMLLFAQQHRFAFPYLFDHTQEVAKAYGAACTPELFAFDIKRALVYQGQYCDARPSLELEVTGKEVRAVLDSMTLGTKMPASKLAMGCGIKWKA